MAIYDLAYTGPQIDELLASIKGLGLRLGGVLTPGATIETPLVDTFWFAPAGTYTYGESQTYTVNTGYLGIIQYMTGTEAWSTQQVLIGTDAAALAACQAAVAELSENLQDVDDIVYDNKDVNLSSETLVTGFFSGSGAWSTDTGAGRTIFLPVLPNEKYIMTASASQNFYTILHSMFDTTQAQAQADIDYATGYSTRVQLAQGASVALTIPSDGYFLAFRADISGGNSFAPDLQKLIPIKDEIKDNFNRIGERRKIVLPNAITLGGWISNTTFKWASRSTTYFSIIPVIGGKRMHWIYNGGSGYFHYAWLTDFDMIGQRNVTAGGTPSYVAGTSLVFQGSMDNNNVIVPATAKYLYIMHSYGGNANRLPTLYWIDQASDMEVNDVYSRVRGKYVSILGDSITSYYNMPTADAGDVYAYPQFSHFGVISWQQCWWGNLIERCGMNLLRNASWKGSTCCGNSQDTSWKTGCSDARVALLTDGTTQPDIIIVAIGINDWIQDKTLGTFDPRALIPADGDLQVFVDAYIKMLAKLQAAYHHARIFCCTLMMSAHNTHDVDGKYPDLNDNGVSLYEFNQVIRQVADAMGVDILDISRCGLNFDNLSYYADYDLIHPNNYGMEKVANKAVAELLAKY